MADSKKLPSVFKNEKILKVTIAVGLIAIAVIFLSDFIFGGNTYTTTPTANTELNELYTEKLEEQIENKLADLLSKIEGVGEINVMVTLDSAEEIQSKAIIQPWVRGVAIVCGGGDNPVIKEKVLETVSKVFGISTSKICVTK